jgi:hypothetical protein
MSARAVARPSLDFAVLGNARETLRWLELVLGALPGVQLVDGGCAEPPGEGLSGVIIDRLLEPPPGMLSRRAQRVAVVLADPVRLLSEPGAGPPGERAPEGYAEALRRLGGTGTAPPLVVCDEELLGPRSRVGELLAHLGIREVLDAGALASVSPSRPPPLTQSRRSVLFASVRDDVEQLERIAGRTFRSWRFADEPAQEGGSAPAPGAAGVFYTGRRRDLATPPGLVALSEWDVLPVKLGPLLDRTASLTVLDPLSFPFDALREGDRALPVSVHLPDGWSAEDLTAVLGAPLLAELGPFDEVSVGDDSVFAALRRQYSWPATVRVPGAELPGFATRVALHRDAPLRTRKASDRLLRAAARGELARALDAVSPGERPRAIVLARRIEHWASLVPLSGAGLTGVDTNPEHVRAAAESYPEWRFETELSGEIEVAHVAVSMGAVCESDQAERRRRLQALFSGLRVGGRLVLIEQFLEGRGGRRSGAPTPKELLADVHRVTAGHAVLAQVQALRLSGDDLTSIGLFGFVKVGPTERR